MDLTDTKRLQKEIKDLILFNSCWDKRNQIKTKLQIPQKIIERIKIYRELVRNSLSDVISNIYPYTREILKNEWNKLLPAYLEAYPPTSPILNRVAERFSDYLSKQKNILKRYPFISELALYEWLELEVYEKEVAESNGRKNGQSLLNPIHVLHRFQFPISEIVENIKNKKRLGRIKQRPTTILIYRDPKTLTVRFFELEPGVLAYIELIKKGLREDLIQKKLAGIFSSHNLDCKKVEQSIENLKKILKKDRIIVV